MKKTVKILKAISPAYNKETVDFEKGLEIIKKGILSLNEEKYSFFNGILNGKAEYVYFTKDNYIAYYSVPLPKKILEEKKIGLEYLTERIKIKDGFLHRWDKKSKIFVKADIIKISKCYLCIFLFLKKRLIEKYKRRIIYNILSYNFGKEFLKDKKIEKRIFDE